MDFPPLLEPGFHDFVFEDLRKNLWECFVAPFGQAKQREYLAKHLLNLCGELKNVGLNFEIWFDGSFTTKKPSPNDVDVVVFFDQGEYCSLSTERQRFFDVIQSGQSGGKSWSYSNCDVYFVRTRRPDVWIYWKNLFGFSRDIPPIAKGIARFFIYKEPEA